MRQRNPDSLPNIRRIDTSRTAKRQTHSWQVHVVRQGSEHTKSFSDPPPGFSMDIKFLRTSIRHDVDHGDEREIAKEMKRAGETFRKYSSKQTPDECGEEDLVAAQSKILARCVEMLKNLK